MTTSDREGAVSSSSALDVLWGRRPARRRTRDKPGLSLERIVDAAIELADGEGLAAVSMSRVAERLGFTTMSLYRHVASKEELLLLMSDAAAGDPPQLPDTDDWRSRLASWAWQNRASIQRRPWILDIPIGGPPIGPRQLAWMDRALAAMAGTPLSEDEKALAMLLVTVYVLGQARLTEEVTRGQRAAREAAPEPLPTYGELLSDVIDAEQLPALAKAVAAGVFDVAPDVDLDADFQYGLDRILDGIEARINAT